MLLMKYCENNIDSLTIFFSNINYLVLCFISNHLWYNIFIIAFMDHKISVGTYFITNNRTKQVCDLKSLTFYVCVNLDSTICNGYSKFAKLRSNLCEAMS